jgi:hypothetical protein
MLFKFGNFWKCLLTLIAGWAIYGVVGFEFTVVTLLCAILGHQYKDKKHLP